jgi:hypothetical protein
MTVSERIEKNLTKLIATLDDALATATKERSGALHALITNATSTAYALVQDFNAVAAAHLLDHADEAIHDRDGTTAGVPDRAPMHASSAASTFAKRGAPLMRPHRLRELYAPRRN